MTLKLNLIGEDIVEIKLLQLTDIYSKSEVIIDKNIFTDNKWLFISGTCFIINEKTKTFITPNNLDSKYDNKDTLYLESDEERKETLQYLSIALLQWSDNKIFKNEPKFSETPRIRYYKDMWIIF